MKQEPNLSGHLQSSVNFLIILLLWNCTSDFQQGCEYRKKVGSIKRYFILYHTSRYSNERTESIFKCYTEVEGLENTHRNLTEHKCYFKQETKSTGNLIKNLYFVFLLASK